MATARETGGPIRQAVLPLELGGISEERRQQLELRRQREMTRLQESQQSSTGNFRWSPIAMIPAHLCVLIFLVFLLEKLEGNLGWPWAAVLSPLWVADALFIVIKSKELRKILRTSVHLTSEMYALCPPLGGIIDHLGVAAAKVTLAYRLEGKVDWSLLLLFTPMWICVIIGGTLRCITPPNPQATGEQLSLHRASSFFTGFSHLIARGAQPMLIVLKLDGQVDGPWSSVFIPLWVFMGAIALAGSMLCCCAPMVSRGVIPEIRPLLVRGMLLCSVGTFSLTFCALLFLVFLTLELDNNEDFSATTILAPLIALYALILVFLPLLLLATRHYVRTMRTAEEHFREANDPNGGRASRSSTAYDGVGADESEAGRAGGGGGGGRGEPGARSDVPGGAEEEEGMGRRRRRFNRGPSMTAPTILMRESSTLFRRASVSLCRRLAEADGLYLDPDVSAFDLADWSRRSSGSSRPREADGDVEGGVGEGEGRAPQQSSRSFNVLQDLLPQAREEVSRRGKRFSAVVKGASNRDGHDRFAMSAVRQRAGSEKEGSPRLVGGQEATAKGTPEDDRHDQCLLPGDSGTHSVTDSYDLNSYGSYVDSDEENHEVGLSIDGDEDDLDRDGGADAVSHTSSAPLGATMPPDILLGFGSAHGAAAFSLHGGAGGGGGGLDPGTSTVVAMAGGVGTSLNRWSVDHDGGGRHGVGGSVHGGGGGCSRMPRRLSCPGGMSAAETAGKTDGEMEGSCRGDDATVAHDIETGGAGVADGSGGRGLMAGQPTCYICCERKADAVVMECGHGGLCFTCATHLVATPPHTCPVCRLPIQEILKLHEVREFNRVVAAPVGGGVGRGGGAELKEPEVHQRAAAADRRVSTGLVTEASIAADTGTDFTVSPVSQSPVDGVSTAAAAAAAGEVTTRSNGSAGGRRGPGVFRRFSGPDVVEIPASAVLGGVSSSGMPADALRSREVGEGERRAAGTSRRDTSPPVLLGRRNDLEAQGMCEEGGWLDPV